MSNNLPSDRRDREPVSPFKRANGLKAWAPRCLWVDFVVHAFRKRGRQILKEKKEKDKGWREERKKNTPGGEKQGRGSRGAKAPRRETELTRRLEEGKNVEKKGQIAQYRPRRRRASNQDLVTANPGRTPVPGRGQEKE